MINRMNLFEKRTKSLEEKMTKITKEDDNFKKDVDKRIEVLKDLLKFILYYYL